MTKRAVVYWRQGTIFVRTSSQTTMGPWIDVGPCTSLAADAAPEDIARAVRSHIEASSDGVPFPTSFDRKATKSDPLLLAAGVGSWKTFEKLAKCVEVEAEEAHLKIMPMKNDRPGHTLIEAGVVSLPMATALRPFGEQLLLALELSG